MELGATDVISRYIIFDKAFDGGVHINQFLFKFGESKGDNKSHESAVARKVAANDDDVHALGCGTAALQNSTRGDPVPGPNRKYYCGFRSATVSDLPVSGFNYELSYVHDGKPDPSHVDVALLVTASKKGERKNAKAEAGLELAEKFGPPVPYICEDDKDDQFHPLNIDAENLTKGLPQLHIRSDEEDGPSSQSSLG